MTSFSTRVVGTSGNSLKVGIEGELEVVVHNHPPRGEPIIAYPFSQWFTSDGLATGSNDMTVNGSATPQQFYIHARPDVDVYIKTMSVLISDNGASLDKFGALAALSNGLKFSIKTQELGETILQEGITTNLNFVRLSGGNPSFGDGTGAFKADISGGGADSYLPVIDFSKMTGLQYGLLLRKSSLDQLSFFVNDDLTGLDTFNIKGFGIQML